MDTLHITQAANGTLIIGSEANGTKAWAYELDDDSTIPAGRDATMTVTSRWEGDMLVTEGSLAPMELKEVLSLSADGQALTVEVTTTAPGGDNTTRWCTRRRSS